MKTKILSKKFITHDVIRLVLEKPKGFSFLPGHTTDLSFTTGPLKGKKHPFTLTSSNDDSVLEFIIKIYPKHKDFTDRLSNAKAGTELKISEPFGTIDYQGKGVFLAGGAGVTPFIAILRDLQKKNKLKDNKLIFSNKEQRDIILEKEFKEIFKDNPKDLILILTREKKKGYEQGRIDETLLKKYINKFEGQQFYICGPPIFTFEMRKILKKLGATVDSLVFEGKK